MGTDIRIGTCGYAYPGPPPKGWFGAFYPEGMPSRWDPLEYYARIFTTVEINSSFYGPPSERTAAAWASKTPRDFLFTLKLWQKFTHPSRIGHGSSAGSWEPVGPADVDKMRAALDPLQDAGKLGALVLQYPPSFDRAPQNLERLESTLSLFPYCPKAIELRHKSWSDELEKTREIVERHRAAWIVIDEPKFAASIRQPFEPVGSLFYFRAHGRNARTWWRHSESWERYDYCYSRAEIRQLAAKIANASSRPGLRASFVFFNNHARASAAANAVMMAQELGVPLRAMPPEAMLAQFPELIPGGSGVDLAGRRR
ncbi:MAG TPA: DUF72 domain-containing protein [candidate division Zixibacteria bacterium]|nr:DUF72 domain-containing protein [candidate division Zixibacteria bacterium]